MKITLVCQVKTCKQEYHDINEYYMHVEGHEADKKIKNRDTEAK